MRKQEIAPEERGRHAQELLHALDRLCETPVFRTSPKSCQFLRHIVVRTLNGDTDALKERLIGIDLLGRETTYDTGSDAGVRVRANDVRKRLAAYRASLEDDETYGFDLPTGSYIPRFFYTQFELPEAAQTYLEPPQDVALSERLLHGSSLPLLSFRQLAMPTLVALFLCTICIRWQLSQENPFVSFWQSVFEEHQALLSLPSSSNTIDTNISLATLEAAAPLFNLAGQFHSRFLLAHGFSAPDNDTGMFSASEILVCIGPAAGKVPSATSNPVYLLQTPAGRVLMDRTVIPAGRPLPGRAALLTIDSGPRRTIQIDGTDAEAIGSLVHLLSERDTFPEDVADSLQTGTLTQIVFPLQPQRPAMVYRTSPNNGHSVAGTVVEPLQ